MTSKQITWLSNSVSILALVFCVFFTTSSFRTKSVLTISAGCYNPYTLICNSLPWQGSNPPTSYICNFTGVYGAPYYCTQVECGMSPVQRHCVQPSN